LFKTSCCAALLFFAPCAAHAASPNKIPREVIDQTAAQGTAAVLVGLSVAWEMESTLSNEGLRAQRVAIASAQRDLLTQLEGRRFKVLRRYQEIPGLALEVGADALAELARLPLVTNVLLDHLAPSPAAPSSVTVTLGESTASSERLGVAEKVPANLFKRAASEGTVLVLAGLKTAWQREDRISEGLLELQRNGIHDAQSYILAELVGTSYKVIRIYRIIPGIALRVGVDALKVLQNSPAVTNVIADRPAQPAR
jgi:hypothetical protein